MSSRTEGRFTRLSGDTSQTLDRADELLYRSGEAQKQTKEIAKAVQNVTKAVESLTNIAATKLVNLDKELHLLTKRRTTDDLERKVEELSG